MSNTKLALAIIFSLCVGSVYAQDISDNEFCLECHASIEHPAPHRVHNADGTFRQESHEMWSCIDCHDYITEVTQETHPGDVLGKRPDCLQCHDQEPHTD